MARRDVNYIYLQQQMLYFEMLENAKEFDRMYKNGEISKERFEQAQKSVEIIKDNYFQLSYFMLQLDKPYKGKDRKEWETKNKSLYDALQGFSKEALFDESKSALEDFRRLIEEEKKEEKKNG